MAIEKFKKRHVVPGNPGEQQLNCSIFLFQPQQKTLCASLIAIIYPITVECLEADGRSDRKDCFGILNSILACPGSPRLQKANHNSVKLIRVSLSSLPSVEH